jgi:hypothetical protein
VSQEQHIQQRALQLPDDALGAFCLLAAERLQPIYQRFTEAFAMPQEPLPVLLEQLFQHLCAGTPVTQAVFSARAEALIPDTEDFSDVRADQAQCAAICTAYCVDFLATCDRNWASHALDKVLEALDIYGYEGGPADAALARELAWQLQLLQHLEHHPLSPSLLADLRAENARYVLPSVPEPGA